jgi:integrase
MVLTALAVKNLKPQDKPYTVADGGGLCLVVSPSGGKLWRWRYRYNGKAQTYSLGKWPQVTLEEARKRRDEARMALATGKHPTREKKAQKLRQVAEGENTFERVARTFLAQKGKKLNAKYAKQTLARMEQHVFPMLGKLPIAEITIPDVVRVMEKMGEGGTVETAKRMKQVISQTFRFAAHRGLCAFNPAADMRDVLPPTPEKHHACISPAELPALLRKMDGYGGDTLTLAAMRLLALTFVRTGELIGARWEEIDFDRAEWSIPKERMKMKRPHLVPLARQAVVLLKELQKQTGEKGFVFYNHRGKHKHISNGAVLMALRRMGYKGKMTGHGFRALASTLLNERGYAPDVIERQLAHEDGDKIRSAYNRAEYLLERKKMMQEYADLLDAMRVVDESKVINLTRRRA